MEIVLEKDSGDNLGTLVNAHKDVKQQYNSMQERFY